MRKGVGYNTRTLLEEQMRPSSLRRTRSAERLEDRNLMTQWPTYLGEFEICQPTAREFEHQGETAAYLAVGLGDRGCGGRQDYDSLLRTDGTVAGTSIIGKNMGERLLLDTIQEFKGDLYTQLFTNGRSSHALWRLGEDQKQLALSLGSPLTPIEFEGQLFYSEVWGREIWRTDGETEVLVKDFGDDQVSLTLFQEELIVLNQDDFASTEFWRYNKQNAELEVLIDFEHEAEALLVNEKTLFEFVNREMSTPTPVPPHLGNEIGEVQLALSDGNRFLYEQANEFGLNEYWITDGTSGGTFQIGIEPPTVDRAFERCESTRTFVEGVDHIFFSTDSCGFGPSTYSMSLARDPMEPILIDPGIEFGGAEQSVDIDLADLDRDGDLDAFMTNHDGPNQVWWNDGKGAFTDSGQRIGETQSFATTLGDIDSDGDVDAVVATQSTNRIWLNDGNGFFADSVSLGDEHIETHDVALGYVNDDGFVDIYFANHAQNDLAVPDQIFLGSENGDWIESDQQFPAAKSTGVSLFETPFNEGLNVVVSASDKNFMLLNDGQGQLLKVTHVNLGENAKHIGVTEIDGDGLPDLVEATSEGTSIWNCRSDRKIECHFVRSRQHWGIDSSVHVAFGDLDGDGDQDVVSANGAGLGNTVWINHRGDLYPLQLDLDIPAETNRIALGDIDGDGDIDAVASVFEGPNQVYFNATVSPTFPQLSPDEQRRRADLTGDGEVALSDFSVLAANFGKQEAKLADGDLDNDGEVSFLDFLWFANVFTSRKT